MSKSILSNNFDQMRRRIYNSLVEHLPDEEFLEIHRGLLNIGDEIEALERHLAALQDQMPALEIPSLDSFRVPPNIHLWPAHLREDSVRTWFLMRWANGIRGLFGVPIYLCGSALNDDNKEPRDWDIRLILPNDVFALRYANSYRAEEVVRQWMSEGESGYFTDLRWRWSDECVRYARLGALHTRLNIDFQVYPQAYHDKKFADKPRVQIDSRPENSA